jgi:hypothetical protein
MKLTPLDRLIAWISPRWALRRLEARRALAEMAKGLEAEPMPSTARDDDWRPFTPQQPESPYRILSEPTRAKCPVRRRGRSSWFET